MPGAVKGAYFVGKELGKVAGKASLPHHIPHAYWIVYKTGIAATKVVVVTVKAVVGIGAGLIIGHEMFGE